ncbi:MOSC N-terminal beta barrel domain-containing protein [Janibacter sp. YB324]|nr:MOSC N-terminal beta barrel domain-containing protein [Janibacter sp. YB324]
MHITRIGLTPLKGARHADLDHLRLDPSGPLGDRLFCLLEVDEDRVLRTVENPTMVLVSAARDGAVLTVTTPKGGTVVGEPVPTGDVVEADYWGRPARLEVMTSDHAELLGGTPRPPGPPGRHPVRGRGRLRRVGQHRDHRRPARARRGAGCAVPRDADDRGRPRPRTGQPAAPGRGRGAGAWCGPPLPGRRHQHRDR